MIYQVKNYTFDASEGEITFNDFTTIDLSRIRLIMNYTKNCVIYDPIFPTPGASVSNNVLTLPTDTSGMSDTDTLVIYYEIPDEPVLITTGTITWAGGENLTTEKTTSDIVLGWPNVNPNTYWLLAVQKPTQDSAGDLTINTFNVIDFGGTDKNVKHSTHTVERITGSETVKDFVIQGLFVTQKIKLSGKFATSATGPFTVTFKIYRL